MFWTKQKKVDTTTTDEEIKALKSKINRIETDILDLMQGQVLIRDKIIRKLRLKNINEEEEEDENTWSGIPKSKNINSKVF